MTRAAVLLAAAISVMPWPAEAKFFQLYVQGQGGYSAGSGQVEAHPVFGEVLPTRQDFYDLVSGAAAGAEVGVTLIGLDLHANFLQFFDDSGATGTVTKIILGLRPEFDPGDDGDWTMFVRVGAGAMIATFGGDSPVAVEVGKTPVGFTARGGLGVSYQLWGPFQIGPQADIGYYRLLNGTIQPELDAQTQQDILNACPQDDQACWGEEWERLQAENPDVGLGYETSDGVDWSILLALRAAIGF